MALVIDADESFEAEVSIFSEPIDDKILGEEVPEIIGILPLKNTLLFPGVVIPITVGREKSIQLVKAVGKLKNKLVGVISQKDQNVEEPEGDDLYGTGTVAKIMRSFKMPDGNITILLQGRSRFQVDEYIQKEPYLQAKITHIPEKKPSDRNIKALIRNLKQYAGKAIDLSPNIPREAQIALGNIESLSLLTYFIASNLNVDVPEKQRILETESLKEKAELVLSHLEGEIDVLELSAEIQNKVKGDLDKQQREYFLRQQIRTIQDELGETANSGTDIENLQAKAAKKIWSKEAQQAFQKEISKLGRLQSAMPEYGVTMNYLEWLTDLPWAEYATEEIDLKKAQKVLDADHAGLEKVKDRLLEHLAVLKLNADRKSPILCFYGPPGVGKTSLGKSIAKALGREYVRMSLGGVRDEAEIRGHRRTYIGAMPGKILQGIKKAKSGNPVFILDEIDKVGSDFRGDPSSALLEVLDPEQNHSFQDHYLEVGYGLSRVMFIATANNLASIHPALRDRMEIIEINGYSTEEKLEIAKKHLLPETMEEHGLKKGDIKLNDLTLRAVIEGHTRESGVRNLHQKIQTLCRVVAKNIVLNAAELPVKITPKNLDEYLGIPRFESEAYQKIDTYGVGVGLAWTPVGGDILFIESALSRGKGGISMTGQLGDVMRESATLAYTWIRTHADDLKIPYDVFDDWNLHLHFPAGAVPKDGPSAGITILATIVSQFTRRPVRPHLAMSGEITLRGKVLPVGGIKEKLLAAVRSGIKTVILCKDNQKDVKEIPAEYLHGLEVKYITEMSELIALALEDEPIADPKELKSPLRIQTAKVGF